MGSNRLKWEKRNKIEAARDFSQRTQSKYLYSDIEKETTMATETDMTKALTIFAEILALPKEQADLVLVYLRDKMSLREALAKVKGETG